MRKWEEKPHLHHSSNFTNEQKCRVKRKENSCWFSLCPIQNGLCFYSTKCQTTAESMRQSDVQVKLSECESEYREHRGSEWLRVV